MRRNCHLPRFIVKDQQKKQINCVELQKISQHKFAQAKFLRVLTIAGFKTVDLDWW
jgi:hypothetical protein